MSLAARPPLSRAPAARGARAGALRLLVLAAAAVWLAAGLLGLARYVRAYSLYRGFPKPVTPAGIAAGTVEWLRFGSPALGHASKAEVYLPPGYARAAARGRRFGVLYLLHGHPGKPQDLFRAGAAATVADVLIHQHRIRPLILVAPWGHIGYSRSNEWANTRYGRYESYMLDVVRAVDARLATVPARRDRILAGNSEGGFGAANLTVRDLPVFGGFESWSGYFRETPTAAFQGATRAQLAANSPIVTVPRRAAAIRRLGVHAFLYQGAQDRRGTGDLYAFAATLRAAGAHVGTGVYPGGHDWGLWRAQLPHMLRLASRWMSAPASSGGRA